MPLYKCKCGAVELLANRVTIKIIEGKAVHNITCLDCGEYLKLANPKSGECAGFTSNKYGQL